MSALVTLIEGAAPAVVVAAIGYRASTRAARIASASADRAATASADAERGRVEAQAYERAKSIYEGGIRDLERQVASLRDLADQLYRQVAQERDESVGLRAQVRAMEEQIATMTRTISELRTQLATAAIDAARDAHEPAAEGDHGA